MKGDLDPSRLRIAECVLLAEQLWEQARAHPEEVPVTPAQFDEIHRRLDAFESGQMPPGEPWELVRDRLFRR
jgi:putative addiction module component (TIGR02574 family)